jgi:hypothetical protein
MQIMAWFLQHAQLNEIHDTLVQTRQMMRQILQLWCKLLITLVVQARHSHVLMQSKQSAMWPNDAGMLEANCHNLPSIALRHNRKISLKSH